MADTITLHDGMVLLYDGMLMWHPPTSDRAMRPLERIPLAEALAAEARARAAEKRRADGADRSLRAIRAMRDDDTRAFNARIDELEAERDAIAEQVATLRAAAVCSEIGSDGDGKAYLTCLYCGDGGSVEIPDEIALLSDEDSQTRTWLQAIKKHCLHDHGCPMASPAELQEAEEPMDGHGWQGGGPA